ncbi:ribonuclease H-like domain-containing protein [Tanacetum coccineum]
MFKQLRLEIGLKDALVEMPKFNKWLSSLLRNKEKLEEIAITTVNAECSAIIMNKVPEKLEDPGKFLIPCALQELDRTSALADSGASINLLPHSIYKQLGLGALTPTRMTLELANRSITHPMGIAEDVVVRVDGFTFLADFVVVNFEPDPRVPIILGRPFLRTAKALIDLYEETLTLRVGKEELVYYADKSEKNKDKNFVHAISVIDFSKADPFSGSTTNTLPPSSSLMKTSDNFEKFADELAPPNSLPPGNDVSIHKKDIHEEFFSNPLFEFDDNFKSSNVNPLFKENDKDEGYFDSEGDIAFLDNLLSDDDFHNPIPNNFRPDQNRRNLQSFSPRSDPLSHRVRRNIFIKIHYRVASHVSPILVEEDADSEDEVNESPNLDHQDDPSIPRPPPEPPDIKKCFEPKAGILIIKEFKGVWICQILQEISQKRTRERMSDQEAKEIKAEAREIMPQPSTVNQSPTPYVVPTGKDNVIVSTGRTKVIPAGRTKVIPGVKIYLGLDLQLKDEYETWAMKMEYWIMNSDYNLWNIVLNGNSRKKTGRDPKGNIMILPPVFVEEHIAVQRETKARTILLHSLPEDHMADFHHLDDARDIWLVVKARFGGNDESKKMRKSMLKQEFSEFRVSESEGLHKGYDRFQKILSQLSQMQAKPDNEDCNMKFLRALPPSWSQVAITLKTKGGLDYLSFDDLYNKLRTLEIDVKGGSSYDSRGTSAPTHSPFISAASTNSKISYADSQNQSPSITFTTDSSSADTSSNVIESVLHSFVAESNPRQQITYEDFDQIGKLDLEELDIKWKMAMLFVRINRFEKKARRKMKFNNRDAARFDKKKVKCYKCSELGHFARECTGKQLDSKARYSAFKLKELDKFVEPKALLSVDSMLNWSDHEGEDEEKGAAQVYGMIAGDDDDAAGDASGDVSDDAAEFALMGLSF